MKIKWLYPVLNALVPRIAIMYVTLVGGTSKLRILSPPGYRTIREIFSKPVIYCCWHGRFLYTLNIAKRRKILTMISSSKDGDIIVNTIRMAGLRAIRGSSTRRGKEAFHEMTEALRKGCLAFMLPDGPRGPRYRFKPGSLRLAQAAEVPIIPFSVSSTHGIFLRSWDRFFLPLPFGRSVLAIGEPFLVPRDLGEAEFERMCAEFEEGLERMRKLADESCGWPPDAAS